MGTKELLRPTVKGDQYPRISGAAKGNLRLGKARAPSEPQPPRRRRPTAVSMRTFDSENRSEGRFMNNGDTDRNAAVGAA
jgi:hypothetical protein